MCRPVRMQLLRRLLLRRSARVEGLASASSVRLAAGMGRSAGTAMQTVTAARGARSGPLIKGRRLERCCSSAWCMYIEFVFVCTLVLLYPVWRCVGHVAYALR